MNKTIKINRPDKLLEFLFRELSGMKKTKIRQLLKFGCVSVNDRVITQFDHPLLPGDEIRMAPGKKQPATPTGKFRLEILFEDAHMIAINKPAGLLTIGSEKIRTETAIFAVNDYLNKNKKFRSPADAKPRKLVFIVHRLDRDVSGILLFAKNEKIKTALQDNWGGVIKEYQAVVEGFPEQKKGTVKSHLTENKILRVFSGPKTEISKEAVTHYEVLKTGKENAFLKIQIETGRKHQIRVHMADMGHPIVGDSDYGSKTCLSKRIALHATRLIFKHPVTGVEMKLSCPFPTALERLL